jgi:TRAP-type C4-dicarboxylate transport system substrate-binding protein
MATPIRLDFAFHAPVTSATNQGGLKPFVEAVMREAGGEIAITVHTDEALGGLLTNQVELVDNGTADAAFVIPGFTPKHFPDNFVFGIPGLFNDIVEASMTFSRVVNAGVLRGYENFYVIGAFCTEPFTLHSRPKLTTIADLKGMKLRAANSADEIMLKQLGADARVVPGDKVLESIEDGTIDGTTMHAGPLVDLGVDRVTHYDFYLRLGCAPLTILMNKASFAKLSPKAQGAIRNYSGDWFASHYAAYNAAHNETLLAAMRADPKRTITHPPQSEIDAANVAFKPIVDAWLREDPRNARTLDAVKSEVAKLRA